MSIRGVSIRIQIRIVGARVQSHLLVWQVLDPRLNNPSPVRGKHSVNGVKWLSVAAGDINA